MSITISWSRASATSTAGGPWPSRATGRWP